MIAKPTALPGGVSPRMPVKCRHRVLALSLAAALGVHAGHVDAAGAPLATEFDQETLRAIGLDPALAAHFRLGARFEEGKRDVNLTVNGQSRGRVPAHFDADGELIIDQALLDAAGLRVPDAVHRSLRDEVAVYDIVGAWPQASIKPDASTGSIALLVPEAALADRVKGISHYASGGAAALMNYEISSSYFRFGNSTRRHSSAITETGFNAGDWILRSRQSFTAGDEGSTFQRQETYLQRSTVDMKHVVQMGEITLQSALFGGAPITGIQAMPEEVLRKSSGGAALVEGIANSEARVEIHQAGRLLHSTVVPAGPFAISDFMPLNLSSDLQVTVHEEAGERRFIVPASTFRRASLTVPGTTWAAGQVRRTEGSPGHEPTLVTASTAWRAKHSDSVFSAGAMLATDYNAVALGVDSGLPKGALLSARGSWAVDRNSGQRGGQLEARISAKLGDNASINLSALQRTRGFSTLLENRSADDRWQSSRYRGELSTGLSWSNARLGSLALSTSVRESFSGDHSGRVALSWGRQFRAATVSATLDSSFGGGGFGKERSAYVHVSIPLQRGGITGQMRQRRDRTVVGAAMTHSPNSLLNYRASAERDLDSGNTTVAAGFTATPRYTQVGAGVSLNGDSLLVSGRLSGGLVAHRSGITFSPYTVRETFGIAKVGDRAGTRISTPGGDVWTDASGHAVLPQLRALDQSRIEVITRTLPRKADLDNGLRMLEVSRGSVSRLDFNVVDTRRVLARLVDGNGAPLPKGASVMSGGELSTLVVDDGIAFLASFSPDQPLRVQLPDASQCQVTLSLQAEQNEDAFYEDATGTCVAI